MSEVILFGGTSEGRRLHELLKERGLQALTCVATEYGKELLCGDGVLTGRMGAEEMAELLRRERPLLVADATHPYAGLVSRNIRQACAETGTEYLRVSRKNAEGADENSVDSLDTLIEKLSGTEGVIFATLGAKEAEAFTALPDYRERVRMRLLPSVEGLRSCLELGYPARHLICMQGPFSKALNLAMFRDTDAKVLVTKESGAEGGFAEKLEAAKELNMKVFVLRRPEERDGVTLEDAMERIGRL